MTTCLISLFLNLSVHRPNFSGPEPTKRKVHQGLGLVINQRKFQDAANNRLGTELDVSNLETTFKKFGCPLRVESDLNDQEIREAIDRFVYDVEDTPDLDYLVMVILRYCVGTFILILHY